MNIYKYIDEMHHTRQKAYYNNNSSLPWVNNLASVDFQLASKANSSVGWQNHKSLGNTAQRTSLYLFHQHGNCHSKNSRTKFEMYKNHHEINI